MKNAKRSIALLAVVLLVMLMTGSALAAEESSLNVWIDAVNSTGGDPTLAVPVLWDGTATDGLLTITYDPAVLSVTEDDVAVSENTAMHSTNADQPGTLKISWIAAENGTAGTLLTVNFAVLKANADGKVRLSGEAFGGAAGETAQAVGTAGLPTPTPAPTTAPTAAPTNTPAPGTTPPKTGDDAQPAVWALMAAVCAAGAVICARRLRKGSM